MQESRADIDLAEAVTAKGQPVTARQIRNWREAGVLPPTTVRSLGRGRGREVTYPSDAVDVALGLAQALEEDRNLHRAVLVAFARGVGVADDGLVQAYRQTSKAMAEELRLALSNGKVPEMARLVRPRGRPRKDAPPYEEMIEAICAVMLGRDYKPPMTGYPAGGLRAFLDARFPAAAGLTDADLDQVAASTQLIALAGWAANAAKDARHRLDEARDFLVKLRSEPVLASVLPQLADDFHLALAVPTMLPPIHLLTGAT